MASWGSICDACGHLASSHRMVWTGDDLPTDVYLCLHCPCEITQSSPMTPVTERRWREIQRARAAAVASTDTEGERA